MAKIRIYELAKELGTESKHLESVVRGLGIEIKNYMSTLTVEQAQRVRSETGGSLAPAPSAKIAAKPAAKPAVKPAATSPTPEKKRAAVVRRRGGRPRPAEREREEAAALAAAERAEELASAQERSGGDLRSGSAGAEANAPRNHAAAGSAEIGLSTASATEGNAQGGAVAVSVSADLAMPPKAGGPAVGTIIQLPGGTRKLPGGVRRQQELRDTPAPAPAPVATSSGYVPTQTYVRTKIEQESRPSRRVPSSAASSTQGVSTAPIVVVSNETSAAAPEAVAARDGADKSRVVRNEDGVIVGAAKAKAGPNIVGFVTLDPRPARKQQVIITDASQSQKTGRATARKQREERIQNKGRRGGRGGRAPRRHERTGPKASHTVEMSEAKKRIRVNEVIQVSDLAHQLSVKASRVIRALWGMGMRGITINHSVDVQTAEMVASDFGFTVENVSFDEDVFTGADDGIDGVLRAPVVTVMGHVDHGKTTLLDTIRKAKVAAGEAGGITQHVATYRVETSEGPVVFVDTPGHAAFRAIRERGAQLTDIVVLIVAADDGVMPTTLEAIKYAAAAKVPVVVAINKIDKPDANSGRVKQMLMKEGLVGEEFGGETAICEISAKTGQGIEHLLELLAIQAEVLDLRANPEGRAYGTVIESRIDRGRGSVAVMLVQSGTLQKGDIVVANESSGKVRGVFSSTGEKLPDAGPSTPVEILGLSGTPNGGDRFNVVENERAAKALISHRRELRQRKESARKAPSLVDMMKQKRVPTLKIVVRADVQGSAEALKQTFEELSVDKVRVEVIFAGVGAINETDVKFAHAGEATIIGFNVRPAGKAGRTASSERVPIELFSVIYEAADRVKEMMVDLLEPEYREKDQGSAEVRMVFPIPRLGVVAGCRVLKGTVKRSSHIRVIRDGKAIFEGAVGSLRVFKDDVKEVKEGFECGIVVDGFPGIQPDDVLEAFELETIRPTL